MIHLNIQPPKIHLNPEGGPPNFKTRCSKGESPESPTISWQFDENSFHGQFYANKLFALSQSLHQLVGQGVLPELPECLPFQQRINQTTTLFFPNNIDQLGEAILRGDNSQACLIFQGITGGTTTTIYSQSWVISNLYSDYGGEWNTWWKFENYTLEAGEEIERLQVSPVVLAMLTLQSSLAIDLMKARSLDVDADIPGLDLSITQLAKKLDLHTVSKYLKDDLEETSVAELSDDAGLAYTPGRYHHRALKKNQVVGGDTKPGDSKKKKKQKKR